VSAVGPKHHGNNDSRQIAARFSRRILQVMMSFQKSRGCVKLAIYPSFDNIIGRLPEEFERFVMEILVVVWVRELFADYGDK